MRTLSWQLLALTVVMAVAVLPRGTLADSKASPITNTIAGRISQDREGFLGTNSIVSPTALCGGYDPNTGDSVIMVGGANYMFTLNRHSTLLNFFFGNPNASGSTVDWTKVTSAPFGTIRLSSPIYSCVTTPRTASKSSVFYVSNDRYLYRANPNTRLITATSIAEDPTTEYMWDIAHYNNVLYVLTTNRVVYACTYTSAVSCRRVNIQGDANFNSITTPTRPSLGIAVSADGIFIAPRSNLYWFSLSGEMIAKTPDSVIYIDISFQRSRTAISGDTVSLIAASETNLYSVTIANNALTSTLLTTTPYTSSIAHIYPLTMDSVFVTLPTPNLVQWTTYTNTTVASSIDRTPYPIDFVDHSTVLPQLLSYMDYELMQVAGTVPYPNVVINKATPAVNPSTWNTDFGVDVSDRYYTDALGSAIQKAPAIGNYVRSLWTLESYYNRTNEILHGDFNILPLCSLTQMASIRHALARDVRTLLKYPLIYTGEAKRFTVNALPNITLIKLLMPFPFGTFLADNVFTTNTTTRKLLDTYNASTMMLIYTRMSYPSSRVFDALFPVDKYPMFSTLPAAQQQTLRWAVYADAVAQLEKCAAAVSGNGDNGGNGGNSGNNNNGVSGGDDMVRGCVPRVGINNMTQFPILGVSPTPFNFTIFIPEGIYDNFNVLSCLSDTDWTNVNAFNQTLIYKGKKCGTGCIVAVAVASAVVAAILVVVLVILTSKRRRLATVIVPMSNAEPKFTSTVDADSNYESGNPLTY
ncbi:hypothetical protein ABL78_4412 [Leptomonas seymouri]|uniref:Uncharacterized protein n=1 Tax=Leptomonas seymouri TaxID=5684 RepID=A0A0N1HWL9_LEPSE|nr:hypothetical protein ABL78_4412 [Leptomonas seymouri]|eukprot:KPI86510.1 hypothetical protein ABL78_4412 [Leptomonas seymouri]